MLDCLETTTGAKPAWSVIWLHGLGADANDFAPIVPELVRRDWPALRFVFPNAPVRAVTINGGARMRAWYDILNLSFDQRADEDGVRASMAEMEALIRRERDRGVPPSRVLLAGFSQGAAIALATGLRRDTALAGVIALSGYLPMAGTTETEATVAGKATPMFLGHGRVDPVVPMALGQRSATALRGLGVPLTWQDYPMPHSVCAEEIRDIGDWISARLAGANPT